MLLMGIVWLVDENLNQLNILQRKDVLIIDTFNLIKAFQITSFH